MLKTQETSLNALLITENAQDDALLGHALWLAGLTVNTAHREYFYPSFHIENNAESEMQIANHIRQDP